MFRRVSSAAPTAPRTVLGFAYVGCSVATSVVPLYFSRRFASAPTFLEIMEACKTLDVTVDMSDKDLKKKYRELVRKNHPDAGGDEAAMAKITVAYDRLSSLSRFEKEQYRVQRKGFRGGTPSASYNPRDAGHYGQGGAHWNPYGSNSNRGGPSQGAAHASGYYGHNADANTRAYANSANQGQYYYQRDTGAYSENPFSSRNPFSIHTHIRRAASMPAATLMMRGVVIYLVLSFFCLALYRWFLDWQHDEGWKMSESMARHEKMEEMHRLRQEMSQEIANARQQQLNDYRSHRESYDRTREDRALRYAQQKQQELENNFQAQGWPRISEDKGRIIHRAQDPPGIVFFEPRKEDIRSRQIKVNRSQNPIYTDDSNVNGSNNNTSLNGTAPLMEQQGGVNEDVNEAIRTILGPISNQLRESQG